MKKRQSFQYVVLGKLDSYMQKNEIRMLRGFPGGAVVESLPSDAGDVGSCPGLGRSHMLRSGWAHDMAAEPAHPEPVLCNGRGHSSERPTYCKKQ